ncbi:probable beta-D-xylosidase 2 [Olea europaea subsp. europaea]|uniref:Probable beta-D-xylosidase 2 n=1 Tax=Olea europaea subsp. europaea TaxID=158383 RepID=A0A8S0SAR2_OLEEU|nr:probable beta-D-xylosidase 2 [Olea europaea subsp. europaea]
MTAMDMPIADILFGTHNPGGKLPITWYPQEYLNNLPMTAMDMQSDPSRAIRLSISFYVDVRNMGSRDGTHTLLVYSSPPGGHWAPHKQTVPFVNVYVPARGQQQVSVKIHVCKYLSVVDMAGIQRIPMGEHARHAVSLEAATLGVIKS